MFCIGKVVEITGVDVVVVFTIGLVVVVAVVDAGVVVLLQPVTAIRAAASKIDRNTITDFFMIFSF
jgi:hypothetical protein